MKKLAIFLLVLLLALLAWRGYEYNDMRHHLRKLHDGMTYAEVRNALPTFLVKEELNPCSQHSRYDFWMTLATPGRLHFLYFDKDLILRASFADPATNTPAAEKSHAESAEWRPTPEQTGRFRFDDKGKVVVAEVDGEGRVRLLENGPDSPPLRIRPATIRNRNLFVVEMDDIPDTGRHWTLALDFDAAKRAWIVVGEGETAADIVPEKPGYRTALFRRLDEPPSAPVP